jgi:hypothetical protein
MAGTPLAAIDISADRFWWWWWWWWWCYVIVIIITRHCWEVVHQMGTHFSHLSYIWQEARRLGGVVVVGV